MRSVNPAIREVLERLSHRIHGQTAVVEYTLAALFARGHVLLEGPPGAGKTSLAKGLAEVFGGQFRRIQMTSDLMPSDIVGVLRLKPGASEFEFRPGPLFTNFLLADELNRTSPKTQSALLEAMAEGTVTVDGVAHALPDPFFLIATQNPFESHGVYPLAESQLDRFSVMLEVGFPDEQTEKKIYSLGQQTQSSSIAPLGLDWVRSMRAEVDQVFVEESLIHYCTEIVRKTRTLPGVSVGASVRGGLQLIQTAKALAHIRGKKFISPQEIKDLMVPTLAHRLSFVDGEKSRAERAELLQNLLNAHPAPL